MKDKFNGKIMTKFVELYSKNIQLLIDDGKEDQKPKSTEKVS